MRALLMVVKTIHRKRFAQLLDKASRSRFFTWGRICSCESTPIPHVSTGFSKEPTSDFHFIVNHFRAQGTPIHTKQEHFRSRQVLSQTELPPPACNRFCQAICRRFKLTVCALTRQWTHSTAALATLWLILPL